MLVGLAACGSPGGGAPVSGGCWPPGSRGTGWIRPGPLVPANERNPWSTPNSAWVSSYFASDGRNDLVLNRAYPGYQLSIANDVILPPTRRVLGFGDVAVAGDDRTLLANTYA
jgi:hypothetical protein